MRTLQEVLDDKKRAKGEAIGPSTIVEQAKGNEVAAISKRYSARGYVLTNVQPQGRKRVVLTFELPPEA